MTSIYISREDLYEKVWSKALMQLAPEFGLSDKGLAKICARLEIPIPGRGYWQKLKFGHQVSKTHLPKPSDNCEHFASFWQEGVAYWQAAKHYKDYPLAIQIKEFENKPENKIIVPDSLSKFHPLITNTLNAIQKVPPDKYGLCRPSDIDTLDVYCSKAMAPRIARILNCLITALQKRGHDIYTSQISGQKGTYINYHGEKMQIALLEKLDRVPHKQKNKFEKDLHSSKYSYVPSGKLTLKVENIPYCKAKHKWFDTKTKPLETQLNTIFIDLALVLVFIQTKAGTITPSSSVFY